MYHSRIAGVDIEVVLQTVVAKSGARSLLTLGRTNCGGTAGVEQDVSQINLPRSCSFFLRSFDSLFFQFVCCFALYFSACVSFCISPRFNRFMFVCPSGRKTHTTSSVTALLEGRHTLRPQLLTVCLVDLYPCLPDLCTYGLVSLASYCHKLDLDLYLYIAFV